MGNDQAPRGNHYTPKVMKRMKTHGLSVRLETRGGKQMIWRKLIQGPSAWVKLAPAP
jgi:ribosomal protein L34